MDTDYQTSGALKTRAENRARRYVLGSGYRERGAKFQIAVIQIAAVDPYRLFVATKSGRPITFASAAGEQSG